MNLTRNGSKSPTDTDASVGARVRIRRKEMGLTQMALAEQLGISFQQVQKYENGANRIGAGRLHSVATALSVPVSYFFTDLGPTGESNSAKLEHLLRASGAAELLQRYAAIRSPSFRKALLDLAGAMVEGELGNISDRRVF